MPTYQLALETDLFKITVGTDIQGLNFVNIHYSYQISSNTIYGYLHRRIKDKEDQNLIASIKNEDPLHAIVETNDPYLTENLQREGTLQSYHTYINRQDTHAHAHFKCDKSELEFLFNHLVDIIHELTYVNDRVSGYIKKSKEQWTQWTNDHKQTFSAWLANPQKTNHVALNDKYTPEVNYENK
jgi:hypothetical protein